MKIWTFSFDENEMSILLDSVLYALATSHLIKNSYYPCNDIEQLFARLSEKKPKSR